MNDEIHTNTSESLASHRRADQARHQQEAAVLRDCLEIAMRELAFCQLPTTLAMLRVIRVRLDRANVKVRV